MTASTAEVLQFGSLSRAEYIERLIDVRAGINTVNGRIAPSIIDELTGFFSNDYDYEAENEREKALREKYGLTD